VNVFLAAAMIAVPICVSSPRACAKTGPISITSVT
jgi:hypothetical protein